MIHLALTTTNMERCTAMEYYPVVFFVILHTSLSLILICCKYKFIAAKLVAVHITVYRVRNYFIPCISLKMHHMEKYLQKKL
jgi:hypothetical protein